uniref:SRCR domain-containing protein n=1 Tax=Gasterosteus aculeatus aculeatus TaxID=481459 RepID=G3PJF6_GASAC
MDQRVLVVFLFLWSSGVLPGLQTEKRDNFEEMTDVSLSGGSSRCNGQLRYEDRRKVDDYNWDLQFAAMICKNLDCGSALQISSFLPFLKRHMDLLSLPTIECSDSVRLVNGTSLCSGRLERKSDQSNRSWSSVCEDDFDQQDAEVVCRDLGCGAPSVLQGALYGDGDSSASSTCSSGKAVGLTCSEPNAVRLVGGSSRCAGDLEMKTQGEWRKVHDVTQWNLKKTDILCGKLDCGSAVSTRKKKIGIKEYMWIFGSACLQPNSAVRECLSSAYRVLSFMEINCSESVRLVNGTSLCSGRLEVKSDQSDQSNQSWSSVCDKDFDQQDAEVVCRELGCGAPSFLQGALYGDGKTPMWTKEFRCGGNESALLGCGSSAGSTCSPGNAVGLTCSEPDEIRLVDGSHRCIGRLEMKHEGEWRPVDENQWDLESASLVCGQLACGAVLSIETKEMSQLNAWHVQLSCEHDSMLRECSFIQPGSSYANLEVTCSDFLVQPNISLATHTDGVSNAMQKGFEVLIGSEYTISCSILPQQPGGSFQLIWKTSAALESFTLAAVNHSAHFQFTAADPTHQGEYRCVYHLHVFSHNLSSESQPLRLTFSASVAHLLIRLFVVVLFVASSAVPYLCQIRGSGIEM